MKGTMTTPFRQWLQSFEYACCEPVPDEIIGGEPPGDGVHLGLVIGNAWFVREPCGICGGVEHPSDWKVTGCGDHVCESCVEAGGQAMQAAMLRYADWLDKQAPTDDDMDPQKHAATLRRLAKLPITGLT
jgi:hypothetical protein